MGLPAQLPCCRFGKHVGYIARIVDHEPWSSDLRWLETRCMLVYVLRLQRRLLVQPPLRAPRTYPLRPRPWRQRSVSAVHAVERLLTFLVRREKEAMTRCARRILSRCQAGPAMWQGRTIDASIVSARYSKGRCFTGTTTLRAWLIEMDLFSRERLAGTEDISMTRRPGVQTPLAF